MKARPLRVRPWHQWPLPAQLALTGTGLLLALWAWLAWDLQRQYAREQADVHRQMAATAHVLTHQIQATLLAADLTLLDLREHWTSAPGNFRLPVKRHLAHMDPGLDLQIGIISTKGDLIFSSRGPLSAPFINLDSAGHFSAHRDTTADTLYIGPVYWAPRAQRWAIMLSRPLPRVNGRFAGVVVFGVKPDYLSGAFEALRLGTGSAMALVRNADQSILWRFTDPPTRHGAQPATGATSPRVPMLAPFAVPSDKTRQLTSRVDDAAATGFLLRSSPLDQVERLWTWRKLERFPLTLILGRSTDELLSNYREQRNLILTGGLATSVLLLLALWWMLSVRRLRLRAARRQTHDLNVLRLKQAELKASQEALRQLAAHEIHIKDAEGKRIAQEIHDELGQRLTVLRMEVAMLPQAREAGNAGLQPLQIAGLKQGIDGVLAIVRDLAGKLRPATLDISLRLAVQSLVEEFEGSLGIPCTLDDQLPASLQLDETCSINAYRILQEALTNAARHARARSIRVQLATSDHWLHLRVEDDGVGMPGPQERSPTYGVIGMRERAIALGGRLTIRPGTAGGLIVQADLPLAPLPASGPRAPRQPTPLWPPTPLPPP